LTRRFVEIGGRTFEFEIREGEGTPRVRLDGREIVYDLAPAGAPGTYSLLLEGRSFTITIGRAGESLEVEVNGETFPARIETEGERLARSLRKSAGAASTHRTLRSVMPGIVTRVLVETGSAVAVDTPVVALEAMKMENELRAEVVGVVEKVLVRPGTPVAAHQDLVVIRIADR
jgi:pyruvate carboxylase subunit B